jgi:hypothetical protein
VKKTRHPVQSPRWYASREVALILDTEEWRIRNFGSKAYGLQDQIMSPGTGNRKRYFFEVVLKLAMADELYSAHFNPVGIKAALDLIGKEKLIEQWIASFGAEDKSTAAPSFVLTLSEKRNKETGKWERVWKMKHAKEVAVEGQDLLERGLPAVSLDLGQRWESVVRRITELEGEGQI